MGAMATALTRAYRDRQHRARDRSTRILSQARTSYAKGDRKTALEQVKSVLQSRYVGPEARLLHASILADTGRGGEARPVLANLLQEKPAIAGAAHVLLARILRENSEGSTEKLEESESHYRHAKSLLPETAEAYFLRATIALTVKEKLNLLTQALWIDDSHYASHRLRAYIYYASGKYDEMEHDATAMSAILPQDPLGYSLRAMALGEKGHYAEAITHYDHAIELTPPDDPQIAALHAQRCQVLLQLGEFDRVIRDAEECLDAWPDETILRFHIFCAHTALGDYREATSLFKQVTVSDPTARNRFSYWSKGYVFDALEGGRLWHAADTPEGIAFLDMLEAQEVYDQLSEKARPLIGEGFSPAWSPDGTKLAFSLGVPGFSGLAVYDVLSQETEVLIVPGKDPRWSPDGRTIAFVRDCPLLDLSELAMPESHQQNRPFWDHEVWIINADGTEPRRLTPGSWPSWGKDSKSVYYSSLGRLRVVSTEEGETQGELVLPSTSTCPSVSPDCRYATYVENTSLIIKELNSQSLIDECLLPPGVQDGQWAPDGQHILLGGLDDPESRTGLWIYDLELRQLRKLLRGPITGACWSPDETSLAFSLAPPLSEIWVADLEPNIRNALALDSDQTIVGHYQDMIHYYSRIIEADPNHALSYLKRAQYHQYLDNTEQVTADMDKYVSLVSPRADMNSRNRWFRDMLVAFWQSTPINLGPPINTPKHDIGFVSPDGLALFLESNRSPSHGSFDAWVATRPSVADPWGIPENLGSPINTEYCESIPTISDDNLSLYFTSIDSPSGFGPAVICVSTRETTDAPWNSPRKLGPAINSGRWQHMGSLSADGLELYLASNRPSLDWNSDYDIWVSRRDTRQDDWGVPVNLGPPVNSPYEDLVPIISPDGLTLFFTSERPGGCGSRDIWVSTRSTRESPWHEPINLGPPINTVDWDQIAMISTADSMFYFCSWRPGGYGLLDMYKVPIPKLSDYISGPDNALNSEE
jgi:Tol biopolymer transport system component